MFTGTLAILFTLGILIAIVFAFRAHMEKQAAKAEAEIFREKERIRMLNNDVWSTGIYSDVKMKNLRRAARNANTAPSYFDYHGKEERQ